MKMSDSNKLASVSGPIKASEPPDLPMVLVINLNGHERRLASLGQQLDSMGIPYQRIAGVMGTQEDLKNPHLFNHRAYQSNHGKIPSPGELGCYLSHIRCMETLLNSAHTCGLILEDDAILGSNFMDALATAMANQQDWDVLRLQGFHANPAWHLKTFCHHTQLYTLASHFKPTGCSAAYLVNRKAASRYRQNLLPMVVPYDHEFILGWKYRIRFRSLLPYQVDHPKTQSTITRGHKLPPLKRWRTALYRLKILLFLACYCLWEAGYQQLERNNQKMNEF
jgi:glycosyl transferase family 25